MPSICCCSLVAKTLLKGSIMIRVILKAFLLMTLTVAAASSSITCAQQPATGLTGEWVGNSEATGRSEFFGFSLTENAGELVRPIKTKFTLIQHESDRDRMELSS